MSKIVELTASAGVNFNKKKMTLNEFNKRQLNHKNKILWNAGQLISQWLCENKAVFLFSFSNFYAEVHYKENGSDIDQILTIISAIKSR